MKIKRMIFKLLLAALIVGIVVPAAHSAQRNSYRTVSMQLSTSAVAAAIQPATNATKDWGTAKLLQTIAISVERMVLSPDGNTLAVQTQTASGDAIVQLWDINIRKVINNFSSFSAQGYDDAIAFSPDGKILAISNYLPSSKMLRIQLWDVQSKQQRRTLESILEPQIPQEPDSSPRGGSTIVQMDKRWQASPTAPKSKSGDTSQTTPDRRGLSDDRVGASNCVCTHFG